MKRLRLPPVTVAAVAAVVALGLSGLSACSTFEPDAASVNGEGISRSTFEDGLDEIADRPEFVDTAVQQLGLGEPAARGALPSPLVAEILTQRIRRELFEQEARRLDVEPSDEVRNQLVEQLTQSVGGEEAFEALPPVFRNSLLDAESVRQALSERLADDDDLRREFHEDFQEDFQEVCVRHILVADENEARDILDDLVDGADFAGLAAERSTDTQSGASGGELPCVSANEYVGPFAAAVKRAPLGELMGPLDTQFGFHVFIVDERTPLEFEEADAEIADQAERVLFREADVDVDPRYGTWDPDAGTVNPPPGPESAGSA